MSPAERERALRIAARVFYEDCKHDPDYPHEDWRGQYEEMKGFVSDHFLEFVYEANKHRWSEPELDS